MASHSDEAARPGSSSSAILRLARRLGEAEAELRAAAGDIDAVLLPEGHTYLLADAQRALVASEERSKEQAALLEALLTNAPDHVLHIARDGTLLYVNRAVPPLRPQDLVGASWLQSIAPEEHEPLQRVFRSVIEHGTIASHDGPGSGPDGGVAWYSRRLAPIRRDGEIVGVVAIVRDVTERYRLQQQAHAARLLAERTIATVREPLVVLDGSLCVILANQAFLSTFGLLEGETTGRHFSDLGDHRGVLSQLRDSLGSLLSEHTEFSDFELAYETQNRERGIMLANARLLPSEDRQFILLGFQDVTERDERVMLVERQRQLEATNDELNQFAHSVSHDLRAPLRVIDGFARILLTDYADQVPAEVQRYLGIISGSADKMGQMIEHLLAFSRFALELPTLETVNMNTLVGAVVDAALLSKADRALDIRVDDLPEVRCDPGLLRQVWQNLIDNALKYTGRRELSRIRVRGRIDNTEIIYSVEDNGAGFDMEHASRLFGVFQRLHTSAEFKGTGVGLSIVRRIISRHGGRVWAEGKADVGATFFFSLPRSTRSGSLSPRGASASLNPLAGADAAAVSAPGAV